MTRIFLLSGPIAVGKTALVKQFETRFGARKVSTRQLLSQALTGASREQLIEKGLKLDEDTNGRWVADAFRAAASTDFDSALWLIDAVRTRDQVKHFRDLFGDRVIHIHLDAPIETLRQRYLDRPAGINEFDSYDEARLHGTEQDIGALANIADRVLETDRNDPPSLLAQAVGGLELFPESIARLVDVIVGAQYGSEGKGNICAHLAGEYQVLIRVGGPNAGHKVAHPKYDYVQLPSGTQSNLDAKLLIGAGATLAVKQVLKEIAELNLTPARLSIDPQAIIIEDGDVELEVGSLEVIGSTKKGVGVATARKILGRGDKDHFGIPVRLARDIPEFEGFIRCTKTELENAYAAGHRILLEGTQGTDLSIHHGHYPHVTSRETTASGCLADAGVAPGRVRRVIMVMRTYPIRVGGTSGHMMKEIDFQTVAGRSGVPVSAIEKTEVGTISGKTRRIGEFDWEQARRSAVLNGATDIALTFADYIDAANKNATDFEALTERTRQFVDKLERVTNAKVTLITKDFGPQAKIIDRRDWN